MYIHNYYWLRQIRTEIPRNVTRLSGGIRYDLFNFSQYFLEPFRKGIHEKTSAAFSSGYIGYTFDTKQTSVHLLCTTVTVPLVFFYFLKVLFRLSIHDYKHCSSAKLQNSLSAVFS